MFIDIDVEYLFYDSYINLENFLKKLCTSHFDWFGSSSVNNSTNEKRKTQMIFPSALLFLHLIFVSCAQNVDILRDYFLFKKVSRIAGFSCGNIEDDYEIIKMFNDFGIPASIKSVDTTVDLERFLQTKYWNLGVFVDLRCESSDQNVRNIFTQSSAMNMYGHLHQWLIFGNNMSHTINALNDTNFSITTDLVIFLEENSIYYIYDAYNHCKDRGGSLNVTRFGEWTKEDGLHVSLLQGKFSRRWNFHGMKVTLAGILSHRPKKQNLIDYLKERNPFSRDIWGKFGYSIMVHVADIFNFTFEVVEINYWGENDRNGPLMRSFKKGIYDLGFYPSILTLERFSYAYVLLQVWPTRTCFIFRTEPSSNLNMHTISRPFATSVWYMMALLLIVITLVISVILKVEKVDGDPGYESIGLIIIAALCQQGLPSSSNQSAVRIAFLQIMLFGLLVYNCYSAAIVSSRLNAPLVTMNDSLITLAKSGMKLAAEQNTYFEVLLLNPSPDVKFFKKYWDTIPEEEKFYPVEEGIKKITSTGFAYHTEPVNAYPHIDRIFSKQMICQLTEVHLLRPSMQGLWSQIGSPFSEITKIGLMKIYSAGIQRREVLRWSARKPYCDKDKHYVSSVTIYETGPIIILLFIGMLLAFFICFIEILVFRSLRARAQKAAQIETNLSELQHEISSVIAWQQNKIILDPNIQLLKKVNNIHR